MSEFIKDNTTSTFINSNSEKKEGATVKTQNIAKLNIIVTFQIQSNQKCHLKAIHIQIITFAGKIFQRTNIN